MAFDISIIPWATLSIMLISVAISFMNVGLNRFLISRMVGWHEYRAMQKELAEYNSLRMKALRAKDTKTARETEKERCPNENYAGENVEAADAPLTNYLHLLHHMAISIRVLPNRCGIRAWVRGATILYLVLVVLVFLRNTCF